MWNRVELKERAKAAFTKNYWKCVLVALILSLITAGSSGASGNSGDSNNSGYYTEYDTMMMESLFMLEI
ncbi:MAG: hypothetical protein U0L12_08820 [Ruminococcus sp.]|nr:hypothetical protein [Ruminococcus sp.]